MTFISVVRTIAARSGLYADFSPKPFADKPGNGFHINLSVHSLKNQSDLLPYAIGGILNRISDMTIFLNPHSDSYERLGNCKAPKYITWSPENRSQLIRIPAAQGDYKRLELRSPDPRTNPYIAFALVIYAALAGLKNKEIPPAAVNVNLLSADSADYQALPGDINAAKAAALNSEFIKDALPERIMQVYCK